MRTNKCSTGCPSQDHKSWGECLRSKNLQISPHINDLYSSDQRAWDRELNNYEKARSDGLEPSGTQQHQIDAAYKEAEHG